MNGAATTFEEDGSIHNIIGEPAQGGESSSSAMLLGETTSENVAADASTVHDVHDAVVSTNTNHAGTVQATIYLLLLIHAVFLYQYYAKKKNKCKLQSNRWGAKILSFIHWHDFTYHNTHLRLQSR